MDTLSKSVVEFNMDQSNCKESVPYDVILDILKRVPAEDIHRSTRLVCRGLFKIISTRDFKHAHDLHHQSTFVLLAQTNDFGKRISNRDQLMTLIGLKPDHDLIEISNFTYVSHSPRHFVSCCNGLVLGPRDNPRCLYIMNPVTGQFRSLPRFNYKNTIPSGAAIAYVSTTMEYKVVCGFYVSRQLDYDYRVAIFTVGVDKGWMCRRVDTQHLSLDAKELLSSAHPPLTTTQGGFVHWAADGEFVCCAHVLTLNVETEIITQFPVPSRHGRANESSEALYLPMGRCLSLLILRSKFSWELWEMKPETGEWTEMPSIDLEAHHFASLRDYTFKPVGWLRPREVLVFSAKQSRSWRHSHTAFNCFCFAFTVRTRKLQKFTLDGCANRFLVHRNSLEWINGC